MLTIWLGYINKPMETAMTVDKDGWLHTGDIGHLDADGHIYIVGRIKELIKYNAFQVKLSKLYKLLSLYYSTITNLRNDMPVIRFNIAFTSYDRGTAINTFENVFTHRACAHLYFSNV